jgi:hypothetical protein
MQFEGPEGVWEEWGGRGALWNLHHRRCDRSPALFTLVLLMVSETRVKPTWADEGAAPRVTTGRTRKHPSTKETDVGSVFPGEVPVLT